jgi:hypothetical protein
MKGSRNIDECSEFEMQVDSMGKSRYPLVLLGFLN